VNLSELRTALQDRREDYSQSAAKLNRRINQAYLDICCRRKWGWLRRHHSANTSAPDTTALGITFTNGSPDVNIAGGLTPNPPYPIGTVPIGNSPPTAYGKDILVDGDIYKIVWVGNINAIGQQQWRIEPPFAGATATYDVTILHNELALPRGASGVEEVTLIVGGSQQPQSMIALSTAQMMYRDKAEQGMPSQFAVSRKELVPRPLTPIPALSFSTVGVGGALFPPRPLTDPLVNPRYYAYTYVDKQTGAESVLSPPAISPSTTGAVAGDALQVSFLKADLTVKEDFMVRLYSTLAGGDDETFYFIDESTTAPPSGGFSFQLQDDASDQYLIESGKYRAPDSGGVLSLRFFPTPDTVYHVDAVYSESARAMGEDTDVPVFNADFHQVILDGAEALMLESSDEQRRANQARQRYESGIARMIQLDRLNAQQKVVFGGKKQIRGRPTWWYGAVTGGP